MEIRFHCVTRKITTKSYFYYIFFQNKKQITKEARFCCVTEPRTQHTRTYVVVFFKKKHNKNTIPL